MGAAGSAGAGPSRGAGSSSAGATAAVRRVDGRRVRLAGPAEPVAAGVRRGVEAAAGFAAVFAVVAAVLADAFAGAPLAVAWWSPAALAALVGALVGALPAAGPTSDSARFLRAGPAASGTRSRTSSGSSTDRSGTGTVRRAPLRAGSPALPRAAR